MRLRRRARKQVRLGRWLSWAAVLSLGLMSAAGPATGQPAGAQPVGHGAAPGAPEGWAP